VKLSDNI